MPFPFPNIKEEPVRRNFEAVDDRETDIENAATALAARVTLLEEIKVTQLYANQAGALPLTSAAFTTTGGTLVIFADGSGYSNAANTLIGMDIKVDGVAKGLCQFYTTETLSHKPFVANALVVTGIAAGSHTVTLSVRAATFTDGNDYFSVTVFELP
jgi:hypothetical protein